jgi:16S rRNA processing protein RimM
MEVTVGRIGRAHGVRGYVVVGVRTDEPESRFAVGARLDTDPPAAGPLQVAAMRWHSGDLLVRFEGVNDRNVAEGLRGTWLRVDSASLAPLPDPDEFRDTELIGLSVKVADGTVVGDDAVDGTVVDGAVVDSGTADRTVVGEITDVLHYGQDLLVVRPAAGGTDILIPFVKAIVTDVDVAGGTVLITPPPGLLDPDSAV